MLQVIDMRDGADYAMRQSDFFKGFRAGGSLVQDDDKKVMLKVKDYPPDAEFADVMPRHWQVSAFLQAQYTIWSQPMRAFSRLAWGPGLV